VKIALSISSAALVALCAAATPALAHEQTYAAVLSGLNENPANASLGGGAAVVTLDLDLFTMRVQTTFAGLSGNVSASHVHCCVTVPGGNAGVATQTPTFTGFPLGGTFGSYDHTFDMTVASSYNATYITNNGGTVSTAFSALLAGLDAGRAYLNIHSSFAGGGEIRGFLLPVPEPETYALLLSGLAVVGWVARRRKAT
jgi:CHRD domain/PEP-CTERM motif